MGLQISGKQTPEGYVLLFCSHFLPKDVKLNTVASSLAFDSSAHQKVTVAVQTPGDGHAGSACTLTAMGTSVPTKAGHSWPLDGPVMPSAHSGTGNTQRHRGHSTGRAGGVTDLSGEAGDFQGHNDGKFLWEEVTSEENPRGREAQGTGRGGWELESSCTLDLHHPDPDCRAIGRDRLCQHIQGPQVCVKEIIGGLQGARVWLQHHHKSPASWVSQLPSNQWADRGTESL